MADKYKCDFCSINYSSSSALTTHIKRKHTHQKDFKCSECNEEFYTKADLNIHKLQTHVDDEKAFHCIVDGCDKLFYNESHLIKHFKTHENKNEILYVCEFCQQIYYNYDVYKLHKNEHKQFAIYKCTYENCDKQYSKSSTLKDHIISQHTKNYPYICTQNECNRNFVTKRDLDIHIKRVHTLEKPYNCKFENCTSSFCSSSELNAHVNRIHHKKKYKCEYCNILLSSIDSLKEHVRRKHTKIYTHKCSYTECDAQFYTSVELNTHVKRCHTLERTFICNLCPLKFYMNKDLKRHKNDVHYLKELYKCDVCTLGFKRKEALTNHYKYTHTEEGIQIRKRKEHDIAKLLDECNIQYKREHHVDLKCINGDDTFCRIDFLIIKNGVVIFLEIDEQQHSWYSLSCETRRMAQIYQTLMIENNTLPVVFLRYNPDVFYVDGKKCKLAKNRRHEILIEEINKCSNITKNVVKYLFYDTIEGKPTILNDTEYLPDILSLVDETLCVSTT